MAINNDALGVVAGMMMAITIFIRSTILLCFRPIVNVGPGLDLDLDLGNVDIRSGCEERGGASRRRRRSGLPGRHAKRCGNESGGNY